MHEKAGIRKRQHSINSADNSPIKFTGPVTPIKKSKNNIIPKFSLFEGKDDTKDFKFGSPSKEPLNTNIADPEYRPF